MEKTEYDNELLYMLRQNDTVAWELLLNRYRSVIDYKISEVIYDKYIYYQQKDELRQQGYILLFECLETFNNQKGARFSTFFSFCFERKIRNHVRSLYSNGGMYINALSLDQTVDEGGELTLGENIESNYGDFQADVRVRYGNMIEIIKKVVDSFNVLERSICQLKLAGYSYQEIITKLDCNYKKIDNTMQKFRKSLHEYLREYEDA